MFEHLFLSAVAQSRALIREINGVVAKLFLISLSVETNLEFPSQFLTAAQMGFVNAA